MQFPYKLIDLTHTLTPKIAGNTGIGGCGFNHDTHLNYDDFEGDHRFKVQKLEMHAGIGTHIDAPSHCFEDGEFVDALPLEKLVNACFIIDISAKATPEYSLTAQDIAEFEAVHGKITPGSTVLVRTDWGEKHWENATDYLNNMMFPSVSAESAEMLLERDIAALGIDVISPDKPSDGFPVHKILLGHGKIIIENAANLDQMPSTGGFVATLPIKASGCTEAPVRMIGMLPR